MENNAKNNKYYVFINTLKYISIVIALLLIHYITVYLYSSHCVINIYNYYNIIFSVSPMCSYLLQIITICTEFMNKIWYIIFGFLILNIGNLFNKFNVFSEYEKKP